MVRLRTLIQTLVAFGTNAYLLFPFGGSVIYQGPLKAVCHPGLNCYSCPGALLSCPVGAFQNFLAAVRFRSAATFPLPGAIVVGYLGFIGTMVGRLPCGWLCPFGFIQDLIHKIPVRKFSLWKPLRWVKYGVLGILVIILPLTLSDSVGLGYPWFCKLLCPAGTLEGALPVIMLKPTLWATLGFYFWNKVAILTILLVLMVFISRPFCRMLCPLGAFYSLFTRMTMVHLEFIEGNCVDCGACTRKCPTGVKPSQEFDSPECIMCLKCLDACQFRALQFGIRQSPRAEKKRAVSHT
ncbi:MAG: 4Fe-4S binding protein [Desulfobaccales bacterium]